VRQSTLPMTMRRLERERLQQRAPRYELPTTSSMGRCSATPPLIETQRRLIEGGRMGRSFCRLAAATRSEKEIQTEDISDEQFLSAALLKCTELTQNSPQAPLLRAACSEGDEPPLTQAAISPDDDDATQQQLRRTVSNFELGKTPAHHRSCHHLAVPKPCIRERQRQCERQLGGAAATLPRSAAPATPAATTEQAADDSLSLGSPPALQLSIPDVTDVEQHPQLDQPLSTRSNVSSGSKRSSDKVAATIKANSPPKETTKMTKTVQEHQRQRQPDQVLLTEPQRVALLQAAQARYNDLIWQYNRLPISMGTLRVRNLKIELENELDRLDGDLTVLTLPQVYI
ncbi:hypothetical protein KR093_007682, partial [Drosophila rubida]